MVTEQFRDFFIGEKGSDALRKLMKNGSDLSLDVAKCLQDRVELEVAYAKGLKKSSEAFQKFAGRTKGSLVQAFITISTQLNNESDAHNSVANTVLNQIATPLKNLADTQAKSRKPIEDGLVAKFKTLKEKKENDNKYRQRQFDHCKDIENLYLKMDEIPKTTKNSIKEVSKEVPLMTACILPAGQYRSNSQKIETNLQKAEKELEKTEKKYHDATREVELYRQSCDIEMCKTCDQMESMELDRISEMDKFIQIYLNAIQTLSNNMNEICNSLSSIRVTPQEDVAIEAKLNAQKFETEILLYDIYAENENNVMSQERRLISLTNWIQMLRQDIEVQQRSKDGIVVKTDHHRDGSSPSTSGDFDDDDDGAMHHHKKNDKKKRGIEHLHDFCKQNQKFSGSVSSTDIYTNQESVRLLQCFYQASLYKIERVYNQIKRLPERRDEFSQQLARSSNDKGIPTTFLRLPYKPLVQASIVTSTTSHLARAVPVVNASPVMGQSGPPPPPPPPPYSAHQPTTIGWAVNQNPNQPPVQPDNRSMAAGPPYPVLPNTIIPSTETFRRQPELQHVKVTHAYDARYDDELTIRPGDIIVLMERRSDLWCRGNLNGQIGLFPGNFVEDI